MINILLNYAFMFAIGSIVGWVIELFFRRFFSMKKWINPGFLVGPCLPLYGFGLCGLYTISNINLNFFEGNDILNTIALVIIMIIVMTIIEYIAGLIFIKGMRIRLWDYTNRWGNIQGLICPLFSLLWGLIALIYYLLIHPYIKESLNWLNNHIIFSFVIGFFYGILLVDLIYSFDLANKLKKFAKESKIIIQYESLKESIKLRLKESKLRAKFFLRFHNALTLKEQFSAYLEKMMNKINKK